MSNPLEYDIPDAYIISPQGFVADSWQYQLVIHKGFDNEGIPEKWDDELVKRIPNVNENLKTFAIANNEYCAHCGLWYSTGDTAYVEPVATVPEHRSEAWQKQLFTKHVLVQKNLAPNVLSFCQNKNFIFELDSHFLRKCMIG